MILNQHEKAIAEVESGWKEARAREILRRTRGDLVAGSGQQMKLRARSLFASETIYAIIPYSYRSAVDAPGVRGAVCVSCGSHRAAHNGGVSDSLDLLRNGGGVCAFQSSCDILKNPAVQVLPGFHSQCILQN